MDNILAIWRQKLDEVMDMYEGRVQIALHPADVKTVFAVYCPEDLMSVRDDLAKRTPTHVLLTVEQLDSVLEHFEAASE